MYVQPTVGNKMKARITGVTQGHISLTVEKVLTAIIPCSELDTSRFEIREQKVEKVAKKDDDDSMSEEDLNEPDEIDDSAEEKEPTTFRIYMTKKDKYVSNNASISIRITKMLINQGSLIMYANFA